MTTKPRAPATSTDEVFARLTEMQQAGFASLHWFGADWIERMNDVGAELFSFAAERFREDVAFQHRMLHCKTPAELQALQSEFLQGMIDRYSAESGRMVALTQKLFDKIPAPSGDATPSKG